MVNRIQELRKDAGYTQGQLAQIIGVHPNTVKNWETNESDIKAGNLTQLAALFRCSVEHVIGLPEEEEGGSK